MTNLRTAAQQALEALEMHVPHYLRDRGYPPITDLEAALAEPVPLYGWVFKRNADGTVGIFAPPPRPGESQRTSDCVGPGQRDLHELLGKLADHMAALAEPEPCRYPDCVDNGPDGKCTRWLVDECSMREDYKRYRPAKPLPPIGKASTYVGVSVQEPPVVARNVLLGMIASRPAQQAEPFSPEAISATQTAWKMGYEARKAEEQTEPDSPERRCGGPGCDGACCQPVQEPATLPGPGLVMCPACCAQFDPALNGVDPVQEPAGQLQEDAFGRGQVMWFNKPADLSMLYTDPPQRLPLTEEEIQAAWDSVDMRHPRGNETRIAFARAVERAHNITGENT